MGPTDETFQSGLRTVLARSGRSRRSLSAAMGRDPGYVAALLDPTRPPRARPTPDDMLRASDATGVPFVELLDLLWGIPGSRVAAELGLVVDDATDPTVTASLSTADRATVAAFAAFLAARRSAGGGKALTVAPDDRG